jgi:hypothetical protein
MKPIGAQKSVIGEKKVTNDADWCPKESGRRKKVTNESH